MTTPGGRSGALEAVERIVNRGGPDVVAETLDVLRRLYGSAALGPDGTIHVPGATADDDELLARVAVLVSAHLA